MPLYGIVKSTSEKGTGSFSQKYLEAPAFADPTLSVYQAMGLGMVGTLASTVWNIGGVIRAWTSAGKVADDELGGEGARAGGVLVIGARNQGVLLAHKEKHFSDHVDLDSVLAAIALINPASKQ